MKKEKRNILIAIIALVVLICVITYLCMGYYKKKTLNISNPIVTMEVENFGTIKIELYPDKAPNTVSNFIKLVDNGFYDGLKFHRVIKDFMIQGGDSAGDGTGNAVLGNLKGDEDQTEYCIKGEFDANNFDSNDLNLTEGVIAMARADYTSYSSTLTEESYNSAGTQFFIMTSNDNTSLSGYYAGFGKVIEGMDVVKEIANVEIETSSDEDTTGEESTPKQDVIISSVTVDTFGIDYGMPETVEPFDYMTWLYNYYGISTQVTQ